MKMQKYICNINNNAVQGFVPKLFNTKNHCMKYFRHEISGNYIMGVSILSSQRGLTSLMGCIIQRNHRSTVLYNPEGTT